MQLSDIMNLLNEDALEQIGKQYQIDKVNHKITGKFILKSFVQSILNGTSLSLRSLELLCNSNKGLSSLLNARDDSKKQIDHSSLSKRLKGINYDYFKRIYEDLVEKYHYELIKKDHETFHIFDSTIVTLSGKLLKDGIHVGGKKTDRHIKITVSLKRSIPSSVRLCETQSEVSEDIALVKAINEAKIEKEDILLFDRGISKSETFEALDKEEKKFITRMKENRKYTVVKINPIQNNKDRPLEIISDEVVNLYDKKGKKIHCDLRFIKAKNANQHVLSFLTNIDDLSAQDISEAYKRRWDIEIFFKFIKQNLQIKHFISHHKNGMMVYIYCILITAILFTMFKLMNQLTGFKIALLRFKLAIEKDIIKDIVLFCGGNPDLVDLKL